MIKQPFDILNQFKGETIIVELKNSKSIYKGNLIAFDIHTNLFIDSNFIHGTKVALIYPEDVLF